MCDLEARFSNAEISKNHRSVEEISPFEFRSSGFRVLKKLVCDDRSTTANSSELVAQYLAIQNVVTAYLLLKKLRTNVLCDPKKKRFITKSYFIIYRRNENIVHETTIRLFMRQQ